MPSAPIAGKARHLSTLMQRFHQVQTNGEKEQIAKRASELFPDIGCKYDPLVGLVVYYHEDRVIRLPTAFEHSAGLILRVQKDGQALVMKSRESPVGVLVPASEMLVELGGRIERKSRWERIADGDWF